MNADKTPKMSPEAIVLRAYWKRSKLTQEEIAQQMEVSQGFVTQWMTSRRPVPADKAKQLAALLDCSPSEISSHYRDLFREMVPTDSANLVTHSPRSLEAKLSQSRIASVPRLDVHASMGNGIAIRDAVDIIDLVDINVDELCRARGITITSPKNLYIVTGYGPSMIPTFDHLDPLLVDTGVTDLKVEDVYCMENNNELFIKRIQRVPGKKDTYMMISDNKAFQSFELTNPLRSGFRVHGRVVVALNIKKIV